MRRVTIDRLLRGVPSHRDVRLGTLRVARAHFGQFAQAERYLSSDPEAVRLLYRLEHGHRAYRIDFIRNGNDRFDGDRTIAWDPHSALRTTSGGRQSPALGLLHEEDHAYEREIDAARLSRLQNTFDARYDNREERRVITGVETRAATILGEGARHDHDGSLYVVPSPATLGIVA
jgi:hypothetical protein